MRIPIGQLLILGFDGTEISPRLSALLNKIQPGGVILFARNLVSAQQTHRLLKDCQASVASPLFTCVDMEGGTVDRFRRVIGPSPSAADVFVTANRKLFRLHGKIIGNSCRSLGFNTDFAPVVDLAFEASRQVMNSRAVSADPKKVALYAREFLHGLRQSCVIGAIKHFPGLGNANLDTHRELPSVDQTWKKLWLEDLAPYRALRHDAPMVLISHAAYPAVTRDRTPASLSKKWITDILRKKIGYRGLVVSDDLEMGGVLKAAPIERATVEHIRAGGDLCLICHIEEHVVRSYEALVEEAERDSRFRQRAEDSCKRILAFKKKSQELHRRMPPPDEAKVQKLSRQIWELTERVRLESIKRQAEG